MAFSHPCRHMFGLALSFGLLTGPTFAFTTPPAGSLPLSQILATVEEGGNRTVVSADFHRRNWEVVSCEGRNRICREDYINAATGRSSNSSKEAIVSLPPANGLRASQIAKVIEDGGLGVIGDLEWDDRRWDATLRNDRGRAELKIDPISGKTQRCEGRGCRR